MYQRPYQDVNAKETVLEGTGFRGNPGPGIGEWITDLNHQPCWSVFALQYKFILY